jgi:ABC-type phosphate transport system substrate-binding protein
MIRTVAAIAAAVTLLAACSSNDDKGTAAPNTAPTASAPSSTPPPPAPKAADGNNLKACADATCEVYVKTGTRIPVKSSIFGSSTLIVSKVSAGGIDFGGKSACCSVSATQQQPGKTVRLNHLEITTVAITAPTAILRLKPA